MDGTLSADNLDLNGGLLNGTGTINADLTNAATVSPGDGTNAPGALTVGGYTQTAAGILDINIAGTKQVGQILGGIDAGGTLDIALVNGFLPQAGDSFQILGSLSNTFATINLPSLGNGDSFAPFVNDNGGLTLLVAPAGTAVSTVYWTGDAGDSDWDDPGNWSSVDPAVHNVPQSLLPGAQDNVVIDLSGQTIDHSGVDTIRSLKVTGQNVALDLNAGTLDLSGGGSPGAFQVDQAGDSVALGGSILRSATITGDTEINADADYYTAVRSMTA